jgi:hypothetical protein
MKFYIYLSITTLLLASCKHEPSAIIITDQLIYEKALDLSTFTWYKNSDTLFNKSPLSGHAQAFSRTRYNTIAAKSLNADHKVIDGAIFEEDALIVKELIDANNNLVLYAIQYKKKDHASADEKGWLWAYIKANGEVDISTDKKGVNCTNCHSQTGNIDLTLMNVAHP